MKQIVLLVLFITVLVSVSGGLFPSYHAFHTLAFSQLSFSKYNETLLTSGTLTNGEMRKVCGIPAISQARIVGGTDATLNAWPWMAAIFVRKKMLVVGCGGALINYRFILTAAHCLRYPRTNRLRSMSSLTVRLGELDILSIDDGAQPLDYKVEEMISHEGFKYKIFRHDIALLKLNTDVTFSKSTVPICLPESPELVNTSYYRMQPYIAGWGQLKNGGKASPMLQHVKLQVTEHRECFSDAVSGDKDACLGDSGGPLMITNAKGQMSTIGIISVGYKCAEKGYPGVYTRVASYLDWIKNITGM